MPSTPWPAELDDEIRRLWAEGKTCSQIGMAIGKTRNAVIGKAHRLNLPKRAPRGRARKVGKRPSRTPLPNGKRYVGSHISGLAYKVTRLARVMAKAAAPKKQPPPEPTSATAVRLIDAEPHHCRWIYGDPNGPDTLLCGGGPVVEGRPYCAFHTSLAYTPLTPRNVRLDHLAKAVA